MRGPERESQKGSRETNTVSTGVLMEAPRSGRDAPRGFPELDWGEVVDKKARRKGLSAIDFTS